MRVLLASMVLLTQLSVANAQGDPCIGTLVRDVRTVNAESASTWALAQVIAQQASSTDKASIGITAAIEGVPVNLSGSRAQELASKFSSDTHVSFDQQNSLAVASASLSSNAVEAFRICKDGDLHAGPRVTAYNATPTSLAIKVRWLAPPGAPTQVTPAFSFSGAALHQGSSLPTSFSSNEEYTALFDRAKGQDFNFVANIGGLTDTRPTFVPYIPMIQVITIDQPQSTPEIDLSTDSSGHNRGPVANCVAAVNGTTITNPSITKITWEGPLDDTTYARIDSATPDQVCYSAFLRPLVSGQGGHINMLLKYNLRSTRFKVLN